MNLSERIKSARQAAKMSQADLAIKIGVSREAVSQWESGDTKNIRPQNLFSAAKAMNVDPGWLAMGKNTAPSREFDENVLADLLEKLTDSGLTPREMAKVIIANYPTAKAGQAANLEPSIRLVISNREIGT